MGIRKDQAALTPAERAAFVAAVLALKAEGTYDVFVAQHRTAMQAGTNDPAHNGPAFLPWHREYLRRFERALQTVDPSVWLPYWDSTVNQFVTALPWTADFMGGNGQWHHPPGHHRTVCVRDRRLAAHGPRFGGHPCRPTACLRPAG
jgi:tyrosinase